MNINKPIILRCYIYLLAHLLVLGLVSELTKRVPEKGGDSTRGLVVGVGIISKKSPITNNRYLILPQVMMVALSLSWTSIFQFYI